MSFTLPFCLALCYFGTALPFSCGYHLKMGWMPLHDAVRTNCKNGATTENLGAGVNQGAGVCYLT